jgi:GH25 family lysozyme M1 (1,4-beta-N-acetylmuramidase)
MLYIDVSHYDWDRNKRNLDWSLIKSNGIDVVFIRASYGDPCIYNPTTRYFTEMANAAKVAGFRVGGYHNLIHGDLTSIQRQVTYFRSILDSVAADYAMVDIEPYEALKQNDLWPRLADAEMFAQEFTNQESANGTNRKLTVYLPQWVWSSYLDRADLRPLMETARGPLVNSNYPLKMTKGLPDQLYAMADSDNGPGWIEYGNVMPEIWQYSSNASVPGASSVTDVNAYRGTREELELRMAWVVTRNVQAFKDQMNEFFPNRDKKSDGTIGDYAHSQEKSGHNPDDTAQNNAEWDGDSDTKQEVRAIDIDSNTGDPDVSMENILQHLLKLAKNDKNFPIRYIIYNKRIFRKSAGWAQAAYTGPSPHTEHIHLSGDYSNAFDENYYNYRLDELVALSDDDKAWFNDTINNFFARTTRADNGGITSRIGRDALDQGIPNGLTGTQSTAWKAIYDIGNQTKSISAALQTVLAKIDLDPAELDAIKNALDVPTAEETADAVVSALGGVETNTLVSLLKNALTPEQVANLKAAL